MARWQQASQPPLGELPLRTYVSPHCPALCSPALSLASVWSCLYVDLSVGQNSSLLFRVRWLVTATVSPNMEKKAKKEKEREMGSNFPLSSAPAWSQDCSVLAQAFGGGWRGGWKPDPAGQCWRRHSSGPRSVTGAAQSPPSQRQQWVGGGLANGPISNCDVKFSLPGTTGKCYLGSWPWCRLA